MASQAAKQKRKKKMKTMQMVIFAVMYIIFLIFMLKVIGYKQYNQRMGMTEAVQHVLLNPFDFTGMGAAVQKNGVIIALISVMAGTLIYISSVDRSLRKTDDPATVHGAAHFMTAEEQTAYNKEKTDPIGFERNDGPNNIIFSKEIFLAIDNKATRRNMNVLVIGGSGAGKSFFFIAPNIMQYNCNYVITDPSGELLRDYGKSLEDHGYKIKVFNLTDVYKGNRYNPFHYIKSEKDVFILVETLMKNTTPAGSHSGDPFWEKAEKLLLNVAVLYLWHMYPEEQQTFSNVVELIQQAAKVDDEATASSGEDAKTVLDHMIEQIEEIDPHNLTVRQYKSFKLGADKTVRSILISCSSRLESFTLSDIEYLTSVDDMHFETFTDTKQALFVITPTADTTFGFLTAMLFSQMFSIFYDYCETSAGFGWQAYIPMESHYVPKTFAEKVFHKTVPTGGKEIIKLVQDDEEGSHHAQKKIESLVALIKKNGAKIKQNKNDKLYYIYTKGPDKKKVILGWRGTKEMAENFVSRLKYIKAEKCGDRCPNHVRFLLDEFANIGEVPDFDQKLATMRKYEISCSIVIQAISQLQQHYKDSWNTIAGNCDTKIFLGSDDNETIKWLIETTGKRTVRTGSESYQTKGGGSTSISTGGEDLITPDRVSMLNEDDCIVRIRGLPIYQGPKFKTMNHPAFKYAMATKGTFHVKNKISETQKFKLLPLWKQLELKDKSTIQAMAKQAEEGGLPTDIGKDKPSDKNPDKEEKKTTPLKIPDLYLDKKKKHLEAVKNAARRKEAKEHEAEAKALEEGLTGDGEPLTDDLAESIADSYSVEIDDTDEEIKEKVDTFTDLVQPDLSEINFTLSQ